MRKVLIFLILFPVGSCYYSSSVVVNDNTRTSVSHRIQHDPPTKQETVIIKPVEKPVIREHQPIVLCGVFVMPELPPSPQRLKLNPGLPPTKPIEELITDYISDLETHIVTVHRLITESVESHNVLCRTKEKNTGLIVQ